MNRYLFFALSATLFLTLFGRLAWEIRKENTRVAMNDVHVLTPYFAQEMPPYVKQVYTISLAPTGDAKGPAVPVGKLIREIVREGETNHTRIITETYRFQPPGMSLETVSLHLQSQASLNDMIGLQNIEWDLFLHTNLPFLKLDLYYHLKAGPPSNDDMPIRSELKTSGASWMSFMSMLGREAQLPNQVGDAPTQLIKTEDFQLAGICFSPFTQREGVRLYDNWPVKYIKPEEVMKLAQNSRGGATQFPYRLGRVIITREVDAHSPTTGEPVKAYEAVCRLTQKVDDKADTEFRLTALYLADGTVLQVDTEAAGYRLTARLEHIVSNLSRIADPETGPDTAAHLFNKKALYESMFPSVDVLDPGMEDETPAPAPDLDPTPTSTPMGH